MIDAYKSRGEELSKKAGEAINQLNKYTTPKDFEMIGKPEMPNMLNNFYNRLKSYC